MYGSLPRARLIRTWTLAVVAGEFAGFIPPTLVGITLTFLSAPDLLLILALTLAGALEGAALGTAQAYALRNFAPQIDRRKWILVTAGAAAFAWFVGMLTGTLGSSLPIQPWLALLLFAPLWIAAVGAIGAAQWIVLRQHVRDSMSWVWVNAGAWAIGVSIPVTALTLVPNGWPLWSHGIVGVLAAVAMGLTVGLLTGRTLATLLFRVTPNLVPLG